ncbi:DUF507 family protein, partial [Campylobacter fetus]
MEDIVVDRLANYKRKLRVAGTDQYDLIFEKA